VVSGVPHFSRELVADCKRISPLDELNAASRALIDRRCDQYVEMVWHDGEDVEGESALIAITDESGDHEFGVRGALEDPVALVGEDGMGRPARTRRPPRSKPTPKRMVPLSK
jgi:hypothetical protein